MVLVFEECLPGIGILSVIIYLVVIKKCNNPLTKVWVRKRLQERVAASENKGDEGDVPTSKGKSDRGKHVHKELLTHCSKKFYFQ